MLTRTTINSLLGVLSVFISTASIHKTCGLCEILYDESFFTVQFLAEPGRQNNIFIYES